MSHEILVTGELEIERGMLPRDIAAALAIECQWLLDGKPECLYYYVGTPQTPESEGVITQAFYYYKDLRNSGLVALQSVLDLHPHPESHVANVFVNTQEPDAIQRLHSDFVLGRQVIVHASDGGLFDYCPDDEDRDAVETIEVNAGDVLWLKCPSIRHRGRNPSQNVRHNLVLSSNLPIE